MQDSCPWLNAALHNLLSYLSFNDLSNFEFDVQIKFIYISKGIDWWNLYVFDRDSGFSTMRIITWPSKGRGSVHRKWFNVFHSFNLVFFNCHSRNYFKTYTCQTFKITSQLNNKYKIIRTLVINDLRATGIKKRLYIYLI